MEEYFDRTASDTWERLTSDAPVSRVRATVRAGRDRMRDVMLSRLPTDLSGARILDAGCGAGQMSAELARRGAEVLGVDVSESLLDVARRRLPRDLPGRVDFATADMLDPTLGRFDAVIAMDSLLYYDTDAVGQAVAGLAARSNGPVIFSVAPRTPLLMAMWSAGRMFPRADRAPMMVPQAVRPLSRRLAAAGCDRPLTPVERVSRGFYISHCLEVAP